MAKDDRKNKSKQAVDELLLTQHGYDELVDELEERMKLREEIAAEIDEARKLGDLSENASYTLAMEKKDLNENRINELEDLIARAEVVKAGSSKKVVTIGRQVELKHMDDASKRIVHLVGATEADPMQNKISVESPLGDAVLNSKIGDEITVELPTGTTKYEITKFLD